MSEEVPPRKRRGKRPVPGLSGPSKQIAAAEVQERRRQALELRKRKMTYEAIARAMGLSTPMVAWRYVQDALKAIPAEVASEVKQLEIEDCRDDLRKLNERLAVAGDRISFVDLSKALGAKMKLREQLARYLGLYAPTRTELTGRDGAPLTLTMTDIQSMTDEQLERAISSGSRGPGGAGGARAGAEEEAPGEAGEPH